MRKYLLNENFFSDIDTEEKAYFLGLLFADGYINERLNMVDLTLHHKDSEILENFVKELYTNDRPLKIIRKNYLRLVINSEKIVADLKKHGCFQKKTFKLEFPTTIENNLIKHFMRGYFDGDGCVTLSKNTLTFSIVGTENFVVKYKEILIKECLLSDTKLDTRHKERNNNIRSIRFGGNIIVNRIYHFLYDNSSISLLRKKNKFIDILEKKDYFCNSNKMRNLNKYHILFEGIEYNQSDLAELLSKKLDIKKTTIRRKLQNKWTVDEIISTPLNYHRPIFLKRVCKYDINGNLINKYESLAVASKENGCCEGSIQQAIYKNKKLHKHNWKYE
jgi:hypothetical protein